MSTQASNSVKQKQALSVYTVMLICSALALFIACILLYYELKAYGDFPYWNTRDAQPASASIAPVLRTFLA
ncbi:hypothetical protein EC9_53460 [Rosistilla ulvae]|uniref:Uncharacterized protein n=1 Tax=Rosistilla ulvae TaxID=1930277 RepID=A0A517M8A9_9BACT|nr:hypothetical protein [Rosistilla ulvae]QDS91126.1 hypothetical protein EC9_53460 [Rosistilla ulvae]